MINKKSENFKKVMFLFKSELEKEADFYSQIEFENRDIVTNHSFNKCFNENIILQFNTIKLLDNLDCACCMNDECNSTVEEKIEHVLNDFFEEPEIFISVEFLQAHHDFFK